MEKASAGFLLSSYLARWVAGAALVIAFTTATPAQIARVADVCSLSPEEAKRGLPVLVRGTVTFVEPTLVFIQDESAGTYFRPLSAERLRPGDELEVAGRTTPGFYLPAIEDATARVLRRGALPAPIDADYEDLVAGRYHYQRVAVEGVVRSVTGLTEGRSLLRLASASRVIEVWVEAAAEKERTLVDSHVRVRGIAVGSINNRRQLVQPYVRALDWTEIEIVRPALSDAAVPRVAAADLLTYGVARQGGTRVRVGGTVMAAFPRGMLYLRSERAALAVRLSTPEPVQLGDRIEVLGFAEMGRFSAHVVDAKLAQREPGTPPPPIELHMEDLFRGSYDGDLVVVIGTVTDSFRAERERILVLQEKERRVRLGTVDQKLEVPLGSVVQVTGISRVNVSEGVGYSSQPETIGLYLRSPSDLIVLQRPSWWTVRRLSFFLAMLIGAILLAALWIVLLQLQVRRHAEASRQRIESEAALEERHRLAREFHDTLEQELVGLGIRLDAVATRPLDDKGRGLVEASRRLVSRIQSETRNLVSDLRHRSGATVDLASALRETIELQSPDGGTEVRIEIDSALPPLPVGAVHNMRMIARESVTNALKHSGATQIAIRVQAIAGARIAMSISDNGRGFDAAKETRGKMGHFGCVGMRERAAKLGAEISWQSERQKGSTVEVVLPVQTIPPARPGPAAPEAGCGGEVARLGGNGTEAGGGRVVQPDS